MPAPLPPTRAAGDGPPYDDINLLSTAVAELQGGSADSRLIFEDNCDSSTVPTEVTSTGQLTYNSTDMQRELGGTSASTYEVTFTLNGTVFVQVDYIQLTNLTAGAIEIKLLKGASLVGRLAEQNDHNVVFYDSSGGSRGSASGTGTAQSVGDARMTRFAINTTGRLTGTSMPISGSGTSTTSYKTAQATWTSGQAVAAGDTIKLQIATQSTRKIGIYRVRVYQGVPDRGPAGSTPSHVGVRVKRTSTMSADPTTVTWIGWDAEDYDTHGFHDNVTNNTRLTVPAGYDGYYLIGLTIAGNSAFQASRVLGDITKNGSSIAKTEVGSYTTTATSFSVTTVASLVAGDYIEAYYFHSSASSQTISALSNMWMAKLG